MMAQIENDWYFSDGWVKFVAENAVKGGDLLVFQCLFHNVFNVKLHGPNTVEKNLVGKYMHDRVEKDHEEVLEEKDDDGDEVLPSWKVKSDGADTNGNKYQRHRTLMLIGMVRRFFEQDWPTTNKSILRHNNDGETKD
ncbi:hypothetical protein CDL12_12198 [Handroanthus impetiginosus]|uniref:TF-B3 domain-containing protein n=1 Tax=Handroanthus impetiginosus TaxID=429701 RepID=A0A2G9HCB5_9LAMI|nr:hypothetical protein CDL12_12198 [Handroanthus impetiginosus]